ncbi:Ig-like domain-containing protein [Clostridium luticellarii]|uniref:Ig-like domain-containing protein n=1 Tax=Clostridium luticellarii TaxID=1691940 RepID=UPI00235241A1|nr:Ig-like domain-containing protein [Clostridium luticellarii]MCI1945536.1 Ig-like domain-containing protein [Clostridium luticellarii]MCI1968905.1 Ig-like domain-containing protein [Clostridium luticellarii]
MKKFIKKFVLFCGIYMLVQGFHYTNVLAANNVDELSSKSDITSSTDLHSTSPTSTDNNKDKPSEQNEEAKNTKTADDLNSSGEKSSSLDNVSKEDSDSTQNLSNENKKYYEGNSETTTSQTLVKTDIPVNKSWKIKFNEPVDIDSLKDEIKVMDKNDTKISTVLSSDDYNKSVIVTTAVNYDYDSDYTLIIGGNIVSLYGRGLKNATMVEFKTVPSIVSIDDINTSINQEDNYSLPVKLSAKMSDDSTRSVDVSWDGTLSNTSIPGTYVFNGTVDGYYKTVILQLTINPFVPVQSISNDYRTQSSIGTSLYNYLMNYDNRQSVLESAIELHGGDTSNNCVYFASEALRRVGLGVPTYVANTLTLTSVLESMGWKIGYDLSLLLPGDICFTTSYGYGPTHTYTFMKWADPNSFDYAYICDNQGYDYGGNAYHMRNIDFATEQKDALSYFMYLA